MTSFEDLAQLLIKNVPPSITPDYVRPVCIVKGDFYTMGRQYGRELKQIIYANLLHNLARLNAIWPDKSRLFEELKRYEAAVLAVSPDSISMWQGIADGAGLPYEAAAIYCCYIALAKGPSEGCSTISAYGSACKEGGLIAAANADSFSFTPTSYSPTLVMYPERGNAVIANGGICSNLCLNEKGMIVMASAGGYNGRKEDTGIGIPGVLSTLMLSWKYDLAPQAAGEAARVFTADAENLHCADPDNGSYVIERTACCIHTRRPGDHGERNFLVATNHFISSEMQASRPEDDSRCHNSYSRFATEMKVMQGRYGQLTLKELSKVITMADRYDGENWYRNEWDDEKSYWTPEKRGPYNKTYMQCLASSEKQEFYMIQGQSCTASSAVPYSTGIFSKLKLEKVPAALTAAAEKEATDRLFAQVKNRFDGSLDEAKARIWEGRNYAAMANLASSEEEAMSFYGKAATAFCKAQALTGIIFY